MDVVKTIIKRIKKITNKKLIGVHIYQEINNKGSSVVCKKQILLNFNVIISRISSYSLFLSMMAYFTH